MQYAALMLLAVFYGCYFSKMLAQKKQGIHTDQMGRNTKGLVRGIEIALKISTILVVAAELVSVWIGSSALPHWAGILGILIGTAGIIFFLLSVLTMKNSWRAGLPEEKNTELVSDGVFQISRNPAFLGFDLLYLGIALMFFSWWLFLFSVAVMLLFHMQIVNVEEPFLLECFGEKYRIYRTQVCRYFGRKK